MMKFYSPLRYPGGKNKLTKFVTFVCEKNKINGHYIEPYAGGASVALSLLINGYVKEITINDLDRAIYAFWYSVLHNPEKFCRKIKNTDITIENWHKFKKVLGNKKKASLFDLGFATFFLNRTNRSGIINAGVIGGLKQKGSYKIDCRFNKIDLIDKIKIIAKNKRHIKLYNLNAIDLIQKISKDEKYKDSILYFDPPYFLKGPGLYMNSYKENDHLDVANEIRKIKNMHWIVSYDNQPEIKNIYKWVPNNRIIEFNIQYSAYEIRVGKEILFTSSGLKFPKVPEPTKM